MSEISANQNKIDPAAMFKFSYGLFVLTAKDENKDNGCIINTAIQVTSSPLRMSIAVSKANYTHDMILKTGVFNISILDTRVPFKVFEHFGFKSGRDTDKFADCEHNNRTENGLRYIPKYTNCVISGKVTDIYDYGTHTIFVADVTESIVLSPEPSVTYQYYFDNIKPKPQQKAADSPEKKKGFICKICGYVYEGDVLPDDYICPLCKHGASDFEPL
ncbi:MAG: flavin reductase [Oscillospiraceae bacterium]|nr:flavin reductase [Oscillospiraceae bacterium]